MFISEYLYLPAVTCLLWAVILCMTAFRSRLFPYALATILNFALYMTEKSILAYPDTFQRYTWFATLFMQLNGPCVIPLGILYLEKIKRPARLKAIELAWILIPVALFAVTFILTQLMQNPNANHTLQRTYYLWGNVVYRSVMVASLVFYLIYVLYCGIKEKFSLKHWHSFFSGKGSIPMHEIQTIVVLAVMLTSAARVFLGEVYNISGPAVNIPLTVLLALLLFVFCFMTYFSDVESITLRDAGRVMRYNVSEEERRAETAHIQHLVDLDELDEDDVEFAGNFIISHDRAEDENSLLSRFQHLMLDTQIFLQPRLTLQDVADLLDTNKTYISKLVNSTYNIGFPEMINTLRVDYAEQFILGHREAKQEEIASACGFLSASSFNNTFKKVTGLTPKVWVANWDKKH